MTTATLNTQATFTRARHRATETLTFNEPPRVAMVQDGARLHYAVAAALQRAGQLEAMYTDWYQRDWRDALASFAMRFVKPDVARAMRGRHNAELDPTRVRRMGLEALRLRTARKRFTDDAAYYQWASQQTAQWLSRLGLGHANALFGFVRNLDPKHLAIVRRAGLLTVADQIIAPAAIEKQRLETELQTWRDWQFIDLDAYDRIAEVERETWQHLDHFTCGSNFVRDGLVAQGIDAGRVSVMPYPIDTTDYIMPDRTARSAPVTIGFVGSVNLRKGAPWFYKVAKRFQPKEAQFIMVGPVALEDHAAATCSESVRLVGRVDRSEVKTWLSRFDILLMPSVCEGNAGAVTEAMAMGLPIVTTPGAGTIVRDGVGGFICDHDDVDALTNRVRDLVVDRNLRRAMGDDARRRAEQFNLQSYSDELACLFTRLINA